MAKSRKPNFLTRETLALQRAAARSDRDNTRAVIQYMIERGAFPGTGGIARESLVSRGNQGRVNDYVPYCGTKWLLESDVPTGLGWAERRPRWVVCYEPKDVYRPTKRGPRYTGREWAEVERAEIPHWDAYAYPEMSMPVSNDAEPLMIAAE